MIMEHVTIRTANLDDSVAFYRDVIGLEIKADMRKTAGIPIVFLCDREGGTCVELSQNKSHNGSGISVGFHVEDVEAAHVAMAEKGMNPTPIISPNPKKKFFYIEDPNGLSIQFI